jgi:hypothetical protein
LPISETLTQKLSQGECLIGELSPKLALTGARTQNWLQNSYPFDEQVRDVGRQYANGISAVTKNLNGSKSMAKRRLNELVSAPGLDLLRLSRKPLQIRDWEWLPAVTQTRH